MKIIKQIISAILTLAFAVSAVFNILRILGKVEMADVQIAFIVLVLLVFLVSVLGLALKNIRKDNRVTVNILTPGDEFGFLYAFVVGTWTVTYFIAMIIFK
ncbi:MAG: hypothetical protein FWG34_00380 [Oscillospiraceae bacterium]|nr:hypothetical protein [Oscillospiraceae bacterium]